MVRTIRYIFFLGMLLLMACTKSEFFLDFNLGKEVTDNYNANYYAADKKGGITIQAVASVREGKGELQGFTKKPTLVYISNRKSVFPLIVYVEKGNRIHIEGDKNEPLSWEVDGNKINEQLTEWRKENLKILEKNEKDSVNNAVKKYVLENEKNPVALLLMQCYYNRGENEKEYTELMGLLKDEAIKTEWMKIISRADYQFVDNHYPARLESMILRGQNETADTLMIDKKNPVFMFFWQTGRGIIENVDIIDSIKTLIKDYPDSSRIIADVCLDIDSIAWRSSIRKDTLDKVTRFWSPTGLNDPTIMKLKVNSIPYFIVFDKEGEQLYRGEDLDKAVKEYRNRMKIKK